MEPRPPSISLDSEYEVNEDNNNKLGLGEKSLNKILSKDEKNELWKNFL